LATTDLDLKSGRYQTWRPVFRVPIRSTVGEPKFWRGSALIHVHELTTYGIFGHGLDADEAQHRYVARLDRYADSIVARLVEIARAHPD
jgi:hypothetical protein